VIWALSQSVVPVVPVLDEEDEDGDKEEGEDEDEES